MQMQKQMTLRPSTVKLVARLLAPLIDSGLVSNTEYNAISQSLAYLAKKGEQMPPIPPRLITGQEAAEILGISFSQLRTLEREGAFPFKRRIIGGRNVRYRNTDIYTFAFLDADSVTATPFLPSAGACATTNAMESTNSRPIGQKAS